MQAQSMGQYHHRCQSRRACISMLWGVSKADIRSHNWWKYLCSIDEHHGGSAMARHFAGSDLTKAGPHA
jgi:hypothetical protein